jgi:hypothetical protein
MAVVVKDGVSGLSKGSAFVKFESPAAAQACVNFAAVGLSEAAKGAAASGGSAAGFTGTSGEGLIIKDRRCRADIAVDRNRAQQLKLDNKKLLEKQMDRRNLYLANEGLIVDDAKAIAAGGSGMSDDDRAKRVKAQSEKRKKLVNPLFFVSAHRLSVRNLSKSVTDAELRKLCAKATLSGVKKGLVTSADQDAHLTALGTPSTKKTALALALPPFVDNKGAVKGRGEGPAPGTIKMAKVMLDLQRVRCACGVWSVVWYDVWCGVVCGVWCGAL